MNIAIEYFISVVFVVHVVPLLLVDVVLFQLDEQVVVLAVGHDVRQDGLVDGHPRQRRVHGQRRERGGHVAAHGGGLRPEVVGEACTG